MNRDQGNSPDVRNVSIVSSKPGRALKDTEATIKAHILPNLGDKRIDALTFAAVKQWHHRVAPARLRTKAKASKANQRKVDSADSDAQRARRATANRVLTVLKAALSLAYREGGHRPMTHGAALSPSLV